MPIVNVHEVRRERYTQKKRKDNPIGRRIGLLASGHPPGSGVILVNGMGRDD